MTRKSFAAHLAQVLNPPPVDAYQQLGYQPACVPHLNGQTPGPCGQCAQEQFAAATEFSVLYGGASGGGKTLGALCWALRACAEHPGLRVGAFRRSYPELRESLLAELASLAFAETLGASWNGTEHELRLPNGSLIMFRYAESVKDASRRQGGQYQLLVLDELTLFDPAVVTFLESRLRSGRTALPVLGVRATSNPGGPGHTAVKTRFVDATRYGQKVVTDERGRTVRFIPAKVTDNPFLNPEYAADLAALPEAQRKAFLDGSWDSFAGAMFPELSRERHVVRPMGIPSTWRRYAGIDWGYTAPWAVIWLAEDEDGRLWAYREAYARQVGEKDQATRILEAEAGEQVTRWIDDAAFATRGDAKSIAAVYLENGCTVQPAGKGPGSRIAGWQRIHSYLAEAPGCPHHRAQGWDTCPRLHMFSSCENLWRELSNLPHAATGDPEDADTRVDDHISDALRYALAGLGAGGEFVILDGPPPGTTAPVNMFGAEILTHAGTYAIRSDPYDPWRAADRANYDDPAHRTARRAPWM